MSVLLRLKELNWLHGRQELKWADLKIKGTIKNLSQENEPEIKLTQHLLISPDVERHGSEWGRASRLVLLSFCTFYEQVECQRGLAISRWAPRSGAPPEPQRKIEIDPEGIAAK